MVLYLNRRQMEMVVDSLKQCMDARHDTVEYEMIISRAEKVMNMQCKDDRSSFKKVGELDDRK